MGSGLPSDARLLDEGELSCLDDRFQLGVDAKLAAQTPDVRPHGGVADAKLFGDLAAGHSLGHKAEHLFLARGQPLELGLNLFALADQRGDRPRREKRTAARDRPDRVHHLSRGTRLVYEGAGTSLDGSKTCRIAVLAWQEDHLGLRSHLADARSCISTGAVSQPEVHQHDVRAQLGSSRDRLAHRAGLPDHDHVLLVVDQSRQSIRDHLVVLDDQDSGALFHAQAVGIQNSTLVPRPGSLSIFAHPPARSDRSFRPSKPRSPGRWSRSDTTNPRPLSSTSPWTAPSIDFTETLTRLAAACFSTLVRASSTCLKTMDLNS